MKKHILVISQYFYPEQFRINDICSEWVKRGYKVTVVTGIPNYPQGFFYEGYGYEKKRIYCWNGINIVRLPIKPRKTGRINLIKNYLSFVIEGYKWINKTNTEADLVFTYEVSPMTQALVGVRFARKNKIRHFLYVTDLWPENVSVITGIKSKLLLSPISAMVNYIYKHSDQIFTSSQSFVSKIQSRNIAIDKIHFWPQYAEDFYEKKEFTPVKEIPNDNVPNFVFAGNLGEAQGLDVLVLAAKVLKQDSTLIRFNIIGNGRFEETLKKHIYDNDVSEYFNFIARKNADEIPNYFSNCIAALITLAKSEVFAMTIPAKTQSILKCGIPVLVSADGEIQDIIKSAKCGYCSDSGDFQELAMNIKRILSLDERQLKKLSNNAIEYYLTHYSKTGLLDEMENFINEALAK